MLLWLPALAAIGYVFATLFLKRALTAGCGQAQLNLVASLAPALLFQPLWLWPATPDWSHAGEPVITGGLFVLGQIFTFRALRRGEVSVTTPLLGTKVLLTAGLAAAIFGQTITAQWWLGAAASAWGVVLVTGATWRTLAPRLARPDALYSLAAAALFALADVLVQRWTHHLGVARFVPLMFGVVGLASAFIFVPRTGLRVLAMPARARGALLVGSLLLGVQALGMATSLGLHESATAVNIVYSSRAVWAVVLAWWLARTMRGGEAHDAPAVLRRRLLGSLLLFAAVIAVLI